VDFDQLDGLEKSLDQLWTVLPPQPHFNPVLLVNNAGSLGRLAPIHQLCLQDVRQALDMNVTAGCIYFTLHFLRRIGHSEEIAGSKETQISTTASTSSTGNNDATVSSKVSCSFSNVTVVHISSLAAIAPFQNMSLYCTGKAARDMFHRCIGEEYPTVRVLNYAPGPMETQMQRVLREQLPESQMRTSMVEMFQNGQLVCKDDSARVLISVLDKNTFETGAHIDYYDVAGK
jgi:sepiapterin reductase